tara:strand:- start:403 stop:738 length:336 start_codon:yes stop_codon:yes gene_type:complete
MGFKLKDLSPFGDYANPLGEYTSDSGKKDYWGALTGLGAFTGPYRRDREDRKAIDAEEKEKKEHQKRLDAVNKIGKMAKGGVAKKMAKGGVAKKRNIDGAALRGKTKGSRR